MGCTRRASGTTRRRPLRKNRQHQAQLGHPRYCGAGPAGDGRRQGSFVGECVAVVVAETREAARDALELIDVGYKVLPAVVDEEAAIADGAPQLHDDVPNNITTYFKTGGGDYAAAVRQAVRPKGPFLRPDLSSGWRRARCRAPRVGSCRHLALNTVARNASAVHLAALLPGPFPAPLRAVLKTGGRGNCNVTARSAV